MLSVLLVVVENYNSIWFGTVSDACHIARV